MISIERMNMRIQRIDIKLLNKISICRLIDRFIYL